MKIARVLMLVALFAAGAVLAETPSSPTPTAALTDLLSGSHWAWYEGDISSYKRGLPNWVECYKDGTARVPWRDHPQAWTITEPNLVTISDPQVGDKSTFIMNIAKKSGSREDGQLHIRYEKRASKPARWK
jgi:hypothetical protein